MARFAPLALSVLLLPFFASADVTIQGIFEEATDVISAIILFLEVLCVALFLWGLVKYMLSAGSPEKRKQAKDLIIYGLLGLFILTSFYGIIQLLQATFFGGSAPTEFTPPSAPSFPGS